MKRPSFMHGALLALLFALASLGIYAALSLLLPGSSVIRVLVTILSGSYIAVLVSRSERKTGAITLCISWLVATSILHSFVADGLLFIGSQVGLLWLGRSIVSYRRIIPVMIDLCLCAVAILAALGVANHTQSLFLSVWTFFLFQSLSVGIPLNSAHRRSINNKECFDSRFNKARRNAEAALRRIHEA